MASNVLTLSEKSQESLVHFVRAALDSNKKRNDLHNKMEAIDVAYARYQMAKKQAEEAGTDEVYNDIAMQPCGTLSDITAPIVVSQVDSMVGYLADIWCSGYPMFPVVSTFKKAEQAKKLQAIIDGHAQVGGYPRQLVKFFRNCVKYNIGALEIDWAPIEKYSSTVDYMKPLEQAKIEKKMEHYNRVTSVDVYNLVYDQSVAEMADVPVKGQFAGWVDMYNRIELIKHLQYLKTTPYGYNTTQALATGLGQGAGDSANGGLYYKQKPQISKFVSSRDSRGMLDFDWSKWMLHQQQRYQGRPTSGMYEVARLYARIIPEEHGIYSANKSVPQIWKLEVVNNTKLIRAERVISAYDILPILVGQPFEDGFSEQTQSTAEMQIDYQETFSKLINIRIHAARRAVSDRGIYDPKMIDMADANNPHPAAKIPLKPNARMGNKSLDDAYKSIPFDARGTDGVIQDAALIMDMSGKQTGLNKPQQGEFQKGNKSVTEWQDTMSGSDNRLRLCPMVLEYQVFTPLKDQLKLNIFQYGPTGVFPDTRKGGSIEVTAEDLTKMQQDRENVLFFKVADGYLPTSKIASTQALSEGMVLIGNSPILQAAYGPRLPQIFTHIMHLSGVEGFDEYTPEAQEAQANIQQAQQSGLLPGQTDPNATPATPPVEGAQ